MTTGQQWLGRNVMQGRVLYCPVEDDLEELVRRHRAICNYYNIDAREFPKTFKIAPMVGNQTVLGVFNQRTGLVEPTPVYEAICQEIEEFKPTLVIVGNRVNIFSVEQSSDNHAVQSLQLLSRLCVNYRTTVIMPGHVSLRGQSTGEGTSGSVQWSNGVRSRCYLRYPERDDKEDKPDITRRELEVMKINYAPTGTVLSMQWQPVEAEPGHWGGVYAADAFSVAKPTPLEGETETETRVRVAQETVEADDAMFLATLDRHSAMGSFVSAAPTSKTNAPYIFSLDEECLPRVRMVEKKKRMKAAMGRLFARGMIEIVQWDSPSKRKWRIERTKFQVVK
jgi:RecA-family ATPase